MGNMVGHNTTSNQDIMSNNYGNMGGLMQGNNIDLNGMNPNMVVHLGALNNIGGFNSSMSNNMNVMGQANTNQPTNQNLTGQQMNPNMVLLQQ